jgi:dynein heavy chain, axonemal
LKKFFFQLVAILREVHYLKRNEDLLTLIPEDGLILYEKEDTFRKYRINLSITIEWYNQIRKNSQKVEFDLVKEEIDAIDIQINKGQSELSWNAESKYYKNS